VQPGCPSLWVLSLGHPRESTSPFRAKQEGKRSTPSERAKQAGNKSTTPEWAKQAVNLVPVLRDEIQLFNERTSVVVANYNHDG
jgi:hypothetical protein